MKLVIKDLKYHRGTDSEGKEDVRPLESGEVAMLFGDSIKAMLAQQGVSCVIEYKE